MPSLRSLLGVGREALASRLDHLHGTLTNLGERLRLVVADAVGQNIGSVVSQTFAEALSPSDSKSNLPKEQAETETFDEDDPFGDQQLDADYPMEQFPVDDNTEAPTRNDAPTAERSYRLPIALATGLRTAAWWVRRCWTGWSIAGALSIGVVVGWIAFRNQPLADVGLHLAESSDHLQMVSRAAKSGAQLLI